MPVRTTEQYCSLLLTTCLSLFSIKSLDVSAHGAGSVDKVSNLYPCIGQQEMDIEDGGEINPKIA